MSVSRPNDSSDFAEGFWDNMNESSVDIWTGENVSSVELTNRTRGGRPSAPYDDYRTLIMVSIAIAVAVLALLLNSCVLSALSKVKPSTLRAKIIVQTSAGTNIITPIIGACDILYIEALLGRSIRYTNAGSCFNWVSFTMLSFVSILQSITALGLAMDRVYAVGRPLKYHTVGYNKSARIIMSVLPGGLTVAMFVTALLVTSQTDYGSSQGVLKCNLYFFKLYDLYKADVFFIFHISSHTVCFLIYMTILAVLKYQQNRIKSVSDSSTKKNSLSLVITYFIISISTFCLYLPWPLYPVLVGNVPRANTHLLMTKAMHLLYYFNSCLDPIILMSRIPSIRENLPFCMMFRKTKPEVQTASSTVSGNKI